ncbi:MAG TPA: hypothetical protein VGY76_00940 [Solirubrobacteraceae bacterium]|nr:hypothetical protein [Solirubrobacteraceae bacterium]
MPVALRGRRRLGAAWGAALGAAAIWGAVIAPTAALAASLEEPSFYGVLKVRATTALAAGTLNPRKKGASGTYELAPYEFVYRQSATNECRGAGEAHAPVPAAMSLGGGEELVVQRLESLSPGTEYAICLVTHNGAETESATSPAVSFTTEIPPATPTREEASEITGTTARLFGVLNPAASSQTESYFTYRPSATECTGEESQKASAQPAPAGPGEQGVAAVIPGLQPNTAYTFCLVGRNTGEEEASGAPVTFKTPASVPLIGGAGVRTVGATTAQVTAMVNPGGVSAHYRAEYVSDAAFAASGWREAVRAPTADAELPAGSEGISVLAAFGGLRPDTGYRFRFIASNSLGESQSGEAAEGAFTTRMGVGSAAGLPDGRVYELVSTAGLYGEPYYPQIPASQTSPLEDLMMSSYPFQAQSSEGNQGEAEGDAITYPGAAAAAGGNGAVSGAAGNQWFASRTAGGWQTKTISPQAPSETTGQVSTPYQWFSRDLTQGILEYPGPAPLTQEAPSNCQVIYSRDSTTGAYEAEIGAVTTPAGCGQPLFAGESEPKSPGEPREIIFQSEAALTPGSRQATEIPPGRENHSDGVGGFTGSPCTVGCNLYVSAGGKLRQVNVVEGVSVLGANFGGYPGENGREWPTFSNAISADGSRIFWTDTEGGVDRVFVLRDGSTQVQVSGSSPAVFWSATRDGRYAIYTEGGALWRFDTETDARKELAGTGVEGEAPAVEGFVGMNQSGADAAYVYFVAGNRLASNTNANGESAVNGVPNLYLDHEGTITFIAALSPQDDNVEAIESGPLPEQSGDWVLAVGTRTAQVSPDGRHLVFQSVNPLTGYDNVDSGAKLAEVFVYTAGDPSVACASCDPGGMPPAVGVKGENSTALPVNIGSQSHATQRRWMSDSGGRVFFDSRQSLASGDINGSEDVYEWEAEGEGSCTAESASKANRGCVFLISGGDGEASSWLIETDASGRDVFFEHRGRLGQAAVAGDQNEIYDARVDGGFSVITSDCGGAAGCAGTQPASAPSAGVPPTINLTGTGNVEPVVPRSLAPRSAVVTARQRLARALAVCRRARSRRARVGCERRARARFGPKRAAKQSNGRAK